jgi:major type 1 subunit fimbrin (pilin)
MQIKRMNAKNYFSSILLGSSLLMASNAFAADGTITIQGQVLDASCLIAVNGGVADSSITLPAVSKSSLANTGDTAGAKPFTMHLSGCPISGSVRALFSPLNVDPTTGFLTNNAAVSPATNVQVQVLNEATNPIDLRDNSGNNYIAFVDQGGSGVADLNYAVRYIATGPAIAGAVETQLVYTLGYQ